MAVGEAPASMSALQRSRSAQHDEPHASMSREGGEERDHTCKESTAGVRLCRIGASKPSCVACVGVCRSKDAQKQESVRKEARSLPMQLAAQIKSSNLQIGDSLTFWELAPARLLPSLVVWIANATPFTPAGLMQHGGGNAAAAGPRFPLHPARG